MTRQLHVEIPDESYDCLKLLAMLKKASLRQVLVELIAKEWSSDPTVARWIDEIALKQKGGSPK